MQIHSLFLDPDSSPQARAIAYHPALPLMAAGGTLDSDAAVVFSWATPEGSRAQPAQGSARPPPGTEIPYTTSRPEILATLNSIQALEFSPDGSMLAVGGCDSEKDLVVIYSFASDDFQRLLGDSVGTPCDSSPPGADPARARPAVTIRSRHLHTPKRITCDDGCLALSWSPDSSYLAIAGNTGELVIQPIQARYDFYTYFSAQRRACMKPVQMRVQASRSILGLSWSRCGRLLAVQTAGYVQVYSRGLRSGKLSLKKLARVSHLEPELVGGILRHGRNRGPGDALTRDQLVQAQAGGDFQYHFPLFLGRGPEKYAVESRRALRTMYAIALYKRNLTFSPDSSFLVCTSGFLPVGTSAAQGEQNPELESATFCSYVFERSALLTDGDWASPSVILPGLRCAAVDVAFSPVLYDLTEGVPNCTALPYQMLFAVVAGCDVVVYTTQTFKPIAVYRGENYQQDFLTSVAWSPQGDELCAFGGFSQYLFLRLPRPVCGLGDVQCESCAAEPVYRPFIKPEDKERISAIVDARRERIADENAQGKMDYIDDYRDFYTQYQRYNTGRVSKKPQQPRKPEYKFLSFSKRDSLGDRLAVVPTHLLSPFLCDYQMMPVPRLIIPDSELFSIFASVTDESGKKHWLYEDSESLGLRGRAAPAKAGGARARGRGKKSDAQGESEGAVRAEEAAGDQEADLVVNQAAGDDLEGEVASSSSSEYEEIDIQAASNVGDEPPQKRMILGGDQ